MENSVFGEGGQVVRLKNYLLAEPLTYQGREAQRDVGVTITEDDFYDAKAGLYIEPFTGYIKSRRGETISPDDDPDVIMATYGYGQEIDLRILRETKKNFEYNLSRLKNKLYIIKGTGGSGKTTYLHYLKRNLPSSTEMNIIDFYTGMRQADAFMGASYDLKDLYNDNVYKFITAMLKVIHNILGKWEKTTDEHRGFVKKIVDIYVQHLRVGEIDLDTGKWSKTNMDLEEQLKIFDILEKYSNNEMNYKTLSENLIGIILNKLHSDDSGKVEKLAFITGFVTRLCFCLSIIYSKKYLCVVDNIETFVRNDENHPIQDCDLDVIIHGCLVSISRFKPLLESMQGESGYDPFYGLLIVTRDRTMSAVFDSVSDHVDDASAVYQVDISDWFCTEDIYASRKKYLGNRGLPASGDVLYWTAYNNILEDDSVYRWNLSNTVSMMYRGSHRRVTECVPDAISAVPESEIEYFNQLWKNAFSHGESTSNLKSMCRKYILRILLDQTQRVRYFSRLMVEIIGEMDVGARSLENMFKINNQKPTFTSANSYARKVSTLLHRHSLGNGRDSLVSFQRLIHAILRKPFSGRLDIREIDNLGKIVFLMNENRRSLTNWTSLLCLKFDSSEKYNENNLCKIMRMQWEKYSLGKIVLDDTSEYGIRITKAGCFFAKILPEFEYFTCRFLSCEPPLFSRENLRPFKIGNEVIYRAVGIIQVIRRKAFECISDIIARDEDFFASVGRGGGPCFNLNRMFDDNFGWVYRDSRSDVSTVHPCRIYSHHVGYINNYIEYVRKDIPNEEFTKNGCDKNRFIELLQKEVGAYTKGFERIKESHPEYFAQAEKYKLRKE